MNDFTKAYQAARDELKTLKPDLYDAAKNGDAEALKTVDAFFLGWVANARGPQWIPCSERLPELDEIVLVAAGDEIEIGQFSDFSGELGFTNDHYDEVTHWMPLPTAPTKEPQ